MGSNKRPDGWPLEGLQPVRVRSAADDVALQLAALIEDGRLAPHDKLPPEAELGAALGVARSTVREAKRELLAQGLLDLRGKRGAFVSDRAREVSAVNTAARLLETSVARDLYEVRRAVEVAAIGMAAERRTAEDLERLRKALEQLAAEWNAHDPHESGLAFHIVISECSHNQVMIAVYKLISQFMVRHYGQYYRALADAGEEVRSHQLLLEAIENGDREAAMAAMEKHFDYIEQVRHSAGGHNHEHSTDA